MEEKTLFLFLIGNFGAKEAVAPVDEFHQLCDSSFYFREIFTFLERRRNAYGRLEEQQRPIMGLSEAVRLRGNRMNEIWEVTICILTRL